jgi:hypothetical protein
MALSEIRIGMFSSSGCVALMLDGRKQGEKSTKFDTYVKKKWQERKAKRSLSLETYDKKLMWGKFCEHWIMYVNPQLIGFEYTLSPNTTLEHPKFKGYFVGSRDGLNNNTNAVIDIKCPFTLDSFCDFADCKNIQDVRDKHTDGEKYYWQLVGNASIHGTNKAELIVFMPNEEHLQNISLYAVNGKHDFDSKVYFIGMAEPNTLPFLPTESEYSNLLKFEFEIPQSDFDKFDFRVNEAIKQLDNKITIHEENLKLKEKI